MKFIFALCIIFLNFLFADVRFQQALEYEKKGNYKEAMLLYKQLVKQTIENKSSLEKSLTQEKTIPTTYPADKLSYNEGLKIIHDSIEFGGDVLTNNTIEQILASSFDLYPYKRNYFIPFSYDLKQKDNREQLEAKFQISIKKPIIYNLLGLNETFYVAYTQISFWQLYANSAPFREINYLPEFYMLIPDETLFSSLKAYKIGYLHESNGLAGINSRSWNRLYLEAYFQKNKLLFVPRIWLVLSEDSHSQNDTRIQDYLGNSELNIFYIHKKHKFNLFLRNNLLLDEKNKGFAEFNWSFPFFGSSNNFTFIQLSSGYGDSLIDYNKKINRISFGISLSR